MAQYKPLGTKLIVEVFDLKEKVVNGIIVDSPEFSGFQAKKLRGKIIKIGDEVTKVKQGDTIVFEDYAGVPVDYHIPNIVWMEEEQIVAIETEE